VEDLVYGRRYRVTEKIGSGGMADVFKAVDDVLGRTVAVKVLHPRYASEENFVARFRQEAQAAANLSHPNIVNMYDWGREGETYYIVMEYVNGTDLKTLAATRGPIEPAKAAEYASQVCAALSVAHGYDIIHRDIKPHNIVLTPDGTIKVMDFGIARAGNSTMTQTGSVLGTAQYISPEQAQGKPLTPASDLYSLGVTLYEMVTGQLPFDGETPVATALMQVNDEPVPPREIRGSIPPGLEAVILRAMRKDPAERYASAAEMREDLKRVIAGEAAAGGVYGAPGAPDQTSVLPAVESAAGVRPSRASVREMPKRRMSPWAWVGIAVLVLALVGLGVAFALGAFGPKMIAVPTLVGLEEDAAREALLEAGLTIGEVGTANSDTVELGLVISQDPEAGAKVEEGSAVSIVLSVGIEQIGVPNLSGMTEADAIDALRTAGLDYDKTIREFNTEIAVDLVIRTEPEKDTPVAKGTRIVLVVTKGVESVKVPDVVGKTLADATSLIEAAGFKVKSVEKFHDSVPKGNVITQSPDPGVLYETGSTVTIEVSKGVEVILVPSVVDKTREEAETILKAAGLTARFVLIESDESQDGKVITQFPIAGSSARRGDIVECEVGVYTAP
jgi:serine/threonine-protein kinase